MKKIIFLSVSLIIGFVLFFVALQKVGIENIVSVLSSFTLSQVFLILGLMFLGLVIGAWRWKVVLNAQNLYPRFSDIFVAKLIGHSVNYLTPVMFAGGEPFKALILKGKAKIPLDKGLTSVVIEEVIFLSVSFVFAVLGVVLLFAHFTLPLYFIISVITLIIFCFLILCVFYFKTVNSKSEKGFFIFFVEIFRLDKVNIINSVKPKINEIEQEISYFFRKRKSKLIIACVLSVIEILLLVFTYWLIIIFLKNYLSIGEAISINALINLVAIVPIPASLGSFEWTQVFIFSIFGLGPDIGVAFSLIVRCAMLLIAGIGIILLINFEIKALFEKVKAITQKLGRLLERF
jgi:uncharacterized protein (TIRG00374 family)